MPQVTMAFRRRPQEVRRAGSVWQVKAGDLTAEAPFLLNATYAGVNELHQMLGFEPFKIKYELCEIILCQVDQSLQDTGITVMDGPFFFHHALWQNRPAQPYQRYLYPPYHQLRQPGNL